MSATGWSYLMVVYLALAILGGIFDGISIDADQKTALQTVMQFDVLRDKDWNFLFIEFTTPMVNGDFFAGIASIMTLNYRFLTGDAAIIRWLFLATIVTMTGWVMITVFIPFLFDALATARGFFFGRG